MSTLPFPQRAKKLQFYYQFKKFLEIFKKFHINIPFSDVLAQMLIYARFLKDILKNKRKLNDLAQVTLNKECSVLQNKLPPKVKDPGNFSIPFKIGHFSFDNVLCDLGASINLMSYALSKKLGVGALEPASISLKFADRSIKYPRWIVENVLVKIDKIIFLVDFVILEMDEDCEVSMILGRPFFATSRALINVEKGELILILNDEQVNFTMHQPLKDNPIVKTCFAVNIADEGVIQYMQVNAVYDMSTEGFAGIESIEGHNSTNVDDPP
ncbi:uncharacterized protein [Henckelia pumila]|uniref:uncharacterized protein n=1 Tax=Henckelia pumila TaxID=405737 RepID=UPI003C6E353F